MMITAAVEQLLNRSIGLDAAAIGSTLIERALRDRQKACAIDDPQAYWSHLLASEAERQELIEAVVIPETWFFRDREAFAALARFAVQDWLLAPTPRRLLSLPCSSGEEPYSMAMALLDAGIPAALFSIDGIDISEQALRRARRARYGRNSFRGEDMLFRARHFDDTGHGYQLQAKLRERVRFAQGNFFDDALLPGRAIYDVVFCRNVLIYFDRPAQDHAVGVLTRLLKADGYLFVGPSETALLTEHGYLSARVPMAFAFRHPATAPADPTPASRPPPARQRSARAAAGPAQRPAQRPAVAAPQPVPQPVPPPRAPAAPSLEDISRLADRGQLREAAQACEAHLRSAGPSAQAYYLLGLVRDAGGEAAPAAELYRKSLYLDPKHPEAMAHLALLLERQGDRRGAEALRNRARRLQPKS